MPITRTETIPLKEGEHLTATEERDGQVVITIETSVEKQRAKKLPIPDLEGRLKKIYGDKVFSGPNPVLQEREESPW